MVTDSENTHQKGEAAAESKIVRTTAWVLGGIAALYFALMIVVNNYGATTAHVFSLVGGDENIIFPYILNMYSQPTFKELLLSLLFYGDYTYGFPFYLSSFLSLLPIRLLSGEHFFNMYQTNLLWLRQFVSVLPMLLAAGVIVYLKTRFKHFWFSVLFYLSLLLLPAVVNQSVWFWHPDALAILFAALALLFLDRDDFRLGHNFSIAAVWVGLASSTRMIGYWFVFVIAGYLIYIWLKKKLVFKKLVVPSLLFIGIMFAVILLTSPYLWFEAHRNIFFDRFAFKAMEMRIGYSHDDPYYYQLGPKYWSFTLRYWFMDWPYLAVLAASMVCGLFLGANRKINWLIFGWTLPFLTYTLFFIAPKPYHYLLPTLIFLFAAVVDLPMWVMTVWRKTEKGWLWGGLLVLLCVLGAFFVFQLGDSATRSFEMFTTKIDVGVRMVLDYCLN